MFAKIYLAIRSFIRHQILHIDDRSQLEIAVANGLKIGNDCAVMGECIIDPGLCWLIEIGDRVTLAPRVHILAHDASTKRFLGYTVLGRVKIGSDVFIGAGTIILPGVEIGDKVVVGAGSVVSKSIPAKSVAVGNPAKVIASFDDYMVKRKHQKENAPYYDGSYVIGRITLEQKEEMLDGIKKSGIGFME